MSLEDYSCSPKDEKSPTQVYAFILIVCALLGDAKQRKT